MYISKQKINSVVFNRKIVFFLLIISIIAPLSRIGWYDFKGIFIVTGNDPAIIRIFFYVFSAVTFPVLVYWLVYLISSFSVEKNSFLILIVCAWGFLFGFYYKNDPVYIFGDSYKFLIFVSGIYISRFLIDEKYELKFLKLLEIVCISGLLFSIFRFLMFHSKFTSNVGFIYGTTQDIFLVFSCFVLYFFRKNLISIGLIVLSLTLLILGQKRSVLLLLLIFLPILICFLDFKKLTFQKAFKSILFLIILILSLLITLNSGDFLFNKYFVRITNTDWQDKIALKDGRSEEIQYVFYKFSSNDSIFYLTGFGSGAEYSKFVRGYHADVHSIHVTPVALFYRYGIVGLFLFIYFAILIVKYFWSFLFSGKFRKKFNVIYVLFLFYSVSSFIMSFVVFGFFDDILSGLSFGYIFYYNKKLALSSIF